MYLNKHHSKIIEVGMIDHSAIRFIHLASLGNSRWHHQTDAWSSYIVQHVFNIICPGRLKGFLISGMATYTELSTETAITYSKLP